MAEEEINTAGDNAHGEADAVAESGETADRPEKPDETGMEEPQPGESVKESRKRRSRRSQAENMADLLQKKNVMLQELEKRLSDAEAAVKSKEDKILRMAAEFENYKKRTRREWELLQLKANAELLGRIINVLDDFDRALAAMEGEGDHFVDGIRMIHAGLIDILGRSGLEEMEAEGKLFDPNFHEAIGEAESDRMEPGCVLQIVQKGYMLHDQLLRPARVIVSKAGPGEPE